MSTWMRLGRVAMFIAALAACQAPENASAQRAPRQDRRALLTQLRTQLDQVRSAPPSPENRRGGSLDLSPMVGMTRREIQSALGAPEGCAARVDSQCGGSEWHYDFYRLPLRYRGGGPEIILAFDARGVCTGARWQFSR